MALCKLSPENSKFVDLRLLGLHDRLSEDLESPAFEGHETRLLFNFARGCDIEDQFCKVLDFEPLLGEIVLQLLVPQRRFSDLCF